MGAAKKSDPKTSAATGEIRRNRRAATGASRRTERPIGSLTRSHMLTQKPHMSQVFMSLVCFPDFSGFSSSMFKSIHWLGTCFQLDVTSRLSKNLLCFPIPLLIDSHRLYSSLSFYSALTNCNMCSIHVCCMHSCCGMADTTPWPLRCLIVLFPVQTSIAMPKQRLQVVLDLRGRQT